VISINLDDKKQAGIYPYLSWIDEKIGELMSGLI